ncbi:hypothetical protein INT45_003072 [Circinella minor]|uniref:Tc1-like transposase DDE domain-containing protein n=1 Tax=Circinella minor TaxID=1195481 RepID=A0A8H7VL93_9FUNG|nr:hypothetical protein INT45_003072 [Circinella minor]
MDKDDLEPVQMEKGLTAGKAENLMNIPRRTGYNWLQEDQKNLIDRLEGKVDDDDNLTENRGRKKLLTAEDHKKHLEKTFRENFSTTIDQAMDILTTNFKAAFHINIKRTMAWSKKGERAIGKKAITRAQATAILSALSPHGIINVKVRRPYQSTSENRKLQKTLSKDSRSTAVKITSTVTGHYFNFIANTLNVLDNHEQFKGFYIVMDNVLIHRNVDIERAKPQSDDRHKVHVVKFYDDWTEARVFDAMDFLSQKLFDPTVKKITVHNFLK